MSTRKKKSGERKRGGVYVWRTRKPGSLLGIPAYVTLPLTVAACGVLAVQNAPWWFGLPTVLLTGTHFAYVGETTSFYHRERQHRGNEGTEDEFRSTGKPWMDLNAQIVFRIPLPTSGRTYLMKKLQKWWLRAVETVLICLLWPVYNDRKNRWNPRRIPLEVARRQRFKRETRRLRWTANVRPSHLIILTAVILAATIGG